MKEDTILKYFSNMNEVFIIRNILEYADVGLDVFYNGINHAFFLKMNPYNVKYSSVNDFFSRIYLLHHRNVLNFFNCRLSFTHSEVILPSKDTPRYISFTEMREGEKIIKISRKLHYRNNSVELMEL